MTGDDAVFLRDWLVALIEREAVNTRRMIAAVPEDGARWRPREGAMSALELAWHVAEGEPLIAEVIVRGSFEGLATRPAPERIAEVLDHHARELPPALARVRAIPAARLLEPVRLFGVEGRLVERLAFLPHHSIHHRGQLSTYLRAMGAAVPGAYGWSREERERGGPL